jgi:hypothetical protein
MNAGSLEKKSYKAAPVQLAVLHSSEFFLLETWCQEKGQMIHLCVTTMIALVLVIHVLERKSSRKLGPERVSVGRKSMVSVLVTLLTSLLLEEEQRCVIAHAFVST